MSKMRGYSIGIPLRLWDEARKAENQLKEKGVTFDAGTGFGVRDWELDWSLHGMTPIEIVSFLRKDYPAIAEAMEIHELEFEEGR